MTYQGTLYRASAQKAAKQMRDCVLEGVLCILEGVLCILLGLLAGYYVHILHPCSNPPSVGASPEQNHRRFRGSRS